jgi:hypothetical protein
VLAAPKSLHLAGTISGEATTLLGNIFGEGATRVAKEVS